MNNSNTAHVLHRAATLVAASALLANHNKAVGDHIRDGGRSLVERLCLSEPSHGHKTGAPAVHVQLWERKGGHL